MTMVVMVVVPINLGLRRLTLSLSIATNIIQLIVNMTIIIGVYQLATDGVLAPCYAVVDVRVIVVMG